MESVSTPQYTSWCGAQLKNTGTSLSLPLSYYRSDAFELCHISDAFISCVYFRNVLCINYTSRKPPSPPKNLDVES